MNEISRILDQFRRAYNGDAWHGSPIKAVVEGITSEQACVRLAPGVHTVWELLLHMTAWEGEVARRLKTGEMQMPEEGDWQAVSDTSETVWQSALQHYDRVHAALEQEIECLTDDRLDTVLGTPRIRETGAGVSIYVLLHGVIQHSIYHAGQIALLKKVISTT